jgi:putative ABC transport system permease protein
VTPPPSAPADPALATKLAGVSGVSHVEPVEHRFAYVGADLQDLYAVRASTIGAAGKLQDAYFTGGSAKDVLARLAQQPDAALFSAETVLDFQLHLGDRVHLRLRDAATGRLTDVAFRYAGTAKEFPTAPKDSFIVANAGYIDQQTGTAAPTFLLQTGGASPSVVADRVRGVVGSNATVTDIGTSRRVIGSSLTAVDLAGLTRLELGYALVLTAAAAGLVLALGLVERRRGFAVTRAIGARPSQVAAFIRSEAVVLGVLGGVLGLVAGWVSAVMLVKVLTGVFDPPPAHLAVPWGYLAAVGAMAVAALLVAATATARAAVRPSVEALRDL